MHWARLGHFLHATFSHAHKTMKPAVVFCVAFRPSETNALNLHILTELTSLTELQKREGRIKLLRSFPFQDHTALTM